MSISIILDKSTFQSLNTEEIFFLQRYYTVTIAPALLLEILADLRKEKKGFSEKPRVVDFSKKILQLNPALTIHYKNLIISSLLGNHVNMDGRPLLAGGSAVTAQDGKKGFVFKQSMEEKVLQRWRDSQFTEAEKLLADEWREATSDKNIFETLKQIYSTDSKIESLEKLNEVINEYLNNRKLQSKVLVGITEAFSIDYTIAPKVFYRFEQIGNIAIKDFAPFAYYCYQVYLFFELGIINGLLSTRSTNQIDLEYIYYLPFCKVFSSSDKFHESIARFFIKDDQDFVHGSILKDDLKNIINSRDSLKGTARDRWIEKHKNHPPINSKSVTYQIWRKHVRPTAFSEPKAPQKISKEAQEKIIKKLHEYRNSPIDQNSNKKFEDSETDFVILERMVSPDDYCPCGSGKIFKDCHLPEVIKSQQEKDRI